MYRIKNISLLFLSILSLSLNAQITPSSDFSEGVRYPFSYRGSYWTISRWTGFGNEPKGACLHDISRTGEMELLGFEISGEDNSRDDIIYSQTPCSYTLKSGSDTVAFCFENTDILRIIGNSKAFSISYKKPVELVPVNDHQFRIMINNNRMVLSLLKGRLTIQREDLGIIKRFHNPVIPKKNINFLIQPDENGIFEVALERYVIEYKSHDYNTSFEDIISIRKNESENWVQAFRETNAKFDSSMYDAACMSWMSIIAPQGHHKREAMMISKTWMNGIWSWDHCFNAIAMMYYHPDEAWNNLMCVFDSQDESGALPDAVYVNDLQWGHLKQPIHGWTLGKMMEINPEYFDKDKLQDIYPKLEKWTNFWLEYRDDDKNGIVQINHGNDNFDHLPLYDMGFPVEDPHVNMMLAFQMKVLSDIAGKLGETEKSVSWLNKSESLMQLIIKRSWDGRKFLYKKSGTEEYIDESISVLHYTLLMMGEDLPLKIRETLISGFKNSGLTSTYGILTESKNSPFFDEETYTRGCIWPPLNLFIIEGLWECGEKELARELASRFINTMENNGFAERFAAFTGNPLSDPSYTWTSSIYLILKEKFDL